MGYISKKPISEVEVLKELRTKFKRNRNEFQRRAGNKSKEIAEKYDDYVAAIETALICIYRFPFIDFFEIDAKYKADKKKKDNKKKKALAK